MKFTRNEIKDILKNNHKKFTELEVNLIFSYANLKEHNIEDIGKIYNGVKSITVRHNTRIYSDLSNTILELLEERDFSSDSINRMICLLNSLVNCKFTKLKEDELSLFFREIDKRNFAPENITKLIYGAKNKFSLSSAFDKSKNANLIQILGNETMTKNTKTFLNLHTAYAKFKSSLKERFIPYNHNDVENIIKKCWEAIKIHTNGVDANFKKFTYEEMSKLYTFGVFYSTLTSLEDFGTEFADEIIIKLADRYTVKENLHMKKILADNFISLVENLTSLEQPENEIFSSQEMKDLISKHFKLVYEVDSKKADIVRNILKTYLKSLSTEYSEDESLENIYSKEIIKEDGSLLLMKPFNVYESTQLLLGKTISETFQATNEDKDNLNVEYEKNSAYAIRKKMATLFPNVKIENLTKEKKLDIIHNHPHLFTRLTTYKMHAVIESIIDAICSAYQIVNSEKATLEEKRNTLNRLGFDCNTFFNNDNIVELFSNYPFIQLTGEVAIHKKHLSENISLLSNFLTPPEIQEIIKHNYSSLTVNPKVLHAQITSIFKTNINKIELKEYLFEYFKIKEHINLTEYENESNQVYAKQLEELITQTYKHLNLIIAQPIFTNYQDEGSYNKKYNYLLKKLQRIDSQYKGIMGHSYIEELERI